MKRLLMVTLLLLLTSAFISCNSYDVEGKPEVASNPAKKVFAYYPWESSDTETTDDAATPDTEVSDEVTDEVETTDETTDTVTDNEINDETVNDDTVVQDADEAVADDDTIVVAVKAELEENLTQEFEIYNRGETGELKIFKINLLDPDGNLIESIDNASYKNLFKIQIQKTANGITSADGWNEKVLTFDNTTATEGSNIAPLCPLDTNVTGKECKKSFSVTEYNSEFKILLSYNKTAAKELKENPPADYKISGDFSVEICTNDPSKEKSDSCGKNATSYKIQLTRQPNKPPKPIIKVLFEYTTGGEMSYRNLKDDVSMNLKNTCVSDPDKPEDSKTCLTDWTDRYYIKYKWEMKESPTPLIKDSQISLVDEGDENAAGQWIPDYGSHDPKRAEFMGLMITPRRYADKNADYDQTKCESICGTSEPTNTTDEFYFITLSNYLICRQKYCEEYVTKYYKINIQAETVDKETDLVSDTAEVTVVPKIIPQARVVAQLTWDKGYKTKAELDNNDDGVKVDVDIHMIKKSSLEALTYGYSRLDGLLGTSQVTKGNDCTDEQHCRHDDCSFADQGFINDKFSETIAWYASFDIDNIWGGNNFDTPETIGLGPIEDEDGDGVPDNSIIDDQYLIVVSYSYCTSVYEDGVNRCDKNYTGDDSAYNVNARVNIFVDGVDAPRSARVKNGSQVRPADSYGSETKDFVLHPGEWKVVAVVKWDSNLPSPETNSLYPGDGIVSDVAMTDYDIDTDATSYKICNFSISDAVLVPVWVPEDYYDFVNSSSGGGETAAARGTCYYRTDN